MTLTFNAHRGTVITRTYTVAYRCKEASQRSLNSKTGVETDRISHRCKNVFFYFGHVFGVFKRFFLFSKRFLFYKTFKVHSGKQINKHFQNTATK